MVGLLEHVFTVEEWEEMGRVGVFDEDSRVELIDGRVLDMNPVGDRHTSCVKRLTEMFVIVAHGIAIVSVQDPIRLSDSSEPQPDLALLRYRDDFYRNAKPGPADTLLVVEVADTSLKQDRTKGIYYARAGIAQYWIVDLNGEKVIEFRDPPGHGGSSEDGYHSERAFTGEERLIVDALPQIAFTAAQILA